MTGKVDDVRLPFSTVDPIMGDIYSVLWEPEMLQSMGATINILATEVSVSWPGVAFAVMELTVFPIGLDSGSATGLRKYCPHGFNGIPAATSCSH
jgi:hypothetical protein